MDIKKHFMKYLLACAALGFVFEMNCLVDSKKIANGFSNLGQELETSQLYLKKENSSKYANFKRQYQELAQLANKETNKFKSELEEEYISTLCYENLHKSSKALMAIHGTLRQSLISNDKGNLKKLFDDTLEQQRKIQECGQLIQTSTKIPKVLVPLIKGWYLFLAQYAQQLLERIIASQAINLLPEPTISKSTIIQSIKSNLQKMQLLNWDIFNTQKNRVAWQGLEKNYNNAIQQIKDLIKKTGNQDTVIATGLLGSLSQDLMLMIYNFKEFVLSAFIVKQNQFHPKDGIQLQNIDEFKNHFITLKNEITRFLKDNVEKLPDIVMQERLLLTDWAHFLRNSAQSYIQFIEKNLLKK